MTLKRIAGCPLCLKLNRVGVMVRRYRCGHCNAIIEGVGMHDFPADADAVGDATPTPLQVCKDLLYSFPDLAQLLEGEASTTASIIIADAIKAVRASATDSESTPSESTCVPKGGVCATHPSCEHGNAIRELLERVVVASHMRNHASIASPTFNECDQGFCGEWHKLAGSAK